MRVSVICTARNAAATIGGTLNSVHRQMYGEWEMVVVDDGSTDTTAKIVGLRAAAESRLRLIPTAGMGRGRALNRALAEGNGDLIANIDADDEWHPDFLARTVATLETRRDLAVVSTDAVNIRDDAEPKWLSPPSTLSDSFEITSHLPVFNPICHSAVLMRRSALEDVGGYREDMPNNFDYDLWVRLAIAGHRLGRLPQVLAAKRLHAAQSFETRRRYAYLLGSGQVQLRAIAALGHPSQYGLVPLRLGWGLLPQSLRALVGSRHRRRPPA